MPRRISSPFMTQTIPFFNYPAVFSQREQEYLQAAEGVLRRGAYIMQKDLFDFEDALAHYVGSRQAIGLADGTMAITLGLLAAGLRGGDEVILPSHTFIATGAAVHHAGGIPVLCDCGNDHLIEPDSVKRLLTKKTRAIVPVQLNGRAANMDPILQIANEHDLFIVEDSCQALGSKFKGRQAGTFGKAGAFSFYPSKTLGCFGDGGALVTDDDSIAEKVRLLRDHGRSSTGDVTCFGFNARLDNLQAAILNVKLKHYQQDISKRRELAGRYQERLADVKELRLPPPPVDGGEHFDIFQNYEIEAERRDELREFLKQNGVATILQWGGKTIHQFSDLNLKADCPYTEEMTKRFMLLPLNTSLSLDGIGYIAEQIQRFYAR